MKKYLSTILKIVASVAIVGFLGYKATSNDQFALILHSEKKWGFLALAQLLVTAGIALSFIRWRRLVQAVGIPFSWIDSLRIGFIGHMFGCISIGTFGSDAIRVFYVSRENPEQKAVALVSVFVDRICGLIGLLMLTTLTIFCFRWFGKSEILNSESGSLQSIAWFALGSTVAGLIGFSGIFIFPLIQKTRSFQALTRWRVVGPFFEKSLEAGVVYGKRPLVLGVALLQSIGVHVFLTLSVFCVAIGLGVDHPSLGDHFIISPISHLASVLPLPGGIGGLEGFLWYFYQSISGLAENSVGFIVALAYRIEILIVAILGVVFYLAGRRELRSAIRQQTSDREA